MREGRRESVVRMAWVSIEREKGERREGESVVRMASVSTEREKGKGERRERYNDVIRCNASP
jgi:hypothetical protein